MLQVTGIRLVKLLHIKIFWKEPVTPIAYSKHFQTCVSNKGSKEPHFIRICFDERSTQHYVYELYEDYNSLGYSKSILFSDESPLCFLHTKR